MISQSSKGTNLDKYNLFSENILSVMFLIWAIGKIGLRAQKISIKLGDKDLQKGKLRWLLSLLRHHLRTWGPKAYFDFF